MRFVGLLLPLLVVGAFAAIIYWAADVVTVVSHAAVGVFELFENEAFPLLLSAGIVASALVLAIGYYALIVLPIRLRIWRLTRAVAGTGSIEGFAERFESIDQRFRRDGLIGHAWREFVETLVQPDDDGQPIRNTTRPQSFINSSCAFHASNALRMMSHLPNYFVGIGLLLTFLGLVAALYFANTTVDGSLDDAIGGLKNLLAAATFKFWTSIAGLASSIGLSFVFRLYANAMEVSFERLNRAIEAMMIFATPQRIFYDLRQTAAEQLAETKKINTEVAFTIGTQVSEALEASLPRALGAAMDPALAELRKTSDALSEANRSGMQGMVGEFGNVFRDSAGAQLAAVAETLQQVGGSLSSVQTTMGQSGEDFSRRMAEGTERLEQTMRDVATSLRGLVEELREQLGSVGGSFGLEIETVLSRLAEQSEQVSRQMAESGKAAAEGFSNEILQAARQLENSAGESARATGSLAEDIRIQLGESVTGMNQGIQALTRSLGDVEAQLQRQADVFNQVVSRGEEMSSTLDHSAQSLRGGVAGLATAGRSVSDAVEQLHSAVSGTASQLDAALQSADVLASSLREVSSALEGSWASYRERFEGVDQSLEATFISLRGAVDQQQRQVQEFVGEVDRHFANALTNLSGTISAIQAASEEISDALSELAQRARDPDL